MISFKDKFEKAGFIGMKHPDKILSMTKFVLWIQDNLHLFWDATEENYNTDRAYHLIRKYAQLMQTPLSLEMFVPCKHGEPMGEYTEYVNGNSSVSNQGKYVPTRIKEFRQARKKILFKGWGYVDGFIVNEKELDEFKISGTIEQFISNRTIKATDNFWNQIFRP